MIGMILLIGVLNISDTDIPVGFYEQGVQSATIINVQLSNISLSIVAFGNIPDNKIYTKQKQLPFLYVVSEEDSNTDSGNENKNGVFKDWVKPCLISAGIGLTFYGLYRIRGR
jgi:hypothetical protein